MQIFVINATHEKIFSLEYDRSDTVKIIEAKLENKVGIPHNRRCIVYLLVKV